MSEIIFNICEGKHPISAEITRDARFRTTEEGNIKLYPDSTRAARLLSSMCGCYEVREIRSDPRGRLFEVFFTKSGQLTEILIPARKFSPDRRPVLEVVNPWANGTSKYYRGEDVDAPEGRPKRKKWRSGHRTKIYHPEY